MHSYAVMTTLVGLILFFINFKTFLFFLPPLDFRRILLTQKITALTKWNKFNLTGDSLVRKSSKNAREAIGQKLFIP